MSRSPRISECSTATNANFTATAKSASSVVTAHGPLETNTALSATSADSAFSQVGRQISRFIDGIAGRNTQANVKVKPSRSLPPVINRTLIYRPSVIRRKNMQKWMYTCQACNKPITEFDVQEGAAVMALDGAWHRKHIACVKCGANVGEERRRFVASKNWNRKMAICIDCHMEAENPNCAVCDKQLFENCIEAEGKKMHHICFTCERCKAPFEGGKYALIGDKPYDLDCWYFKQYETSFANDQNSILFALSPPPPIASESNSSMSGPSVHQEPPTFQRKTTELCALLDIPAVPIPPKDKSKDMVFGGVVENDCLNKNDEDKKGTESSKSVSNDDLKVHNEIEQRASSMILPPLLSPLGEKKKINFDAEKLKEPIVPLFSPLSLPEGKHEELKTLKEQTYKKTASETLGLAGSMAGTTAFTTTGVTTTSGTTVASVLSFSSEPVSSTIMTTVDTTTGSSLPSTVSAALAEPLFASTQGSDDSATKVAPKDQPMSSAITPTFEEPSPTAKLLVPPAAAPTVLSLTAVALPVYLTYPIIAGLYISHTPTTPTS